MEQRYIFKAKAINRIEGYNYRTTYNNGDWVEGFITAIEPDCAIMTNREGISGIEVDKETICQCTGAKDHNDVLIFENDLFNISKYRGSVIINLFKDVESKVIYKNGCFIVVNDVTPIAMALPSLITNSDCIIEVIGNAYD